MKISLYYLIISFNNLKMQNHVREKVIMINSMKLNTQINNANEMNDDIEVM